MQTSTAAFATAIASAAQTTTFTVALTLPQPGVTSGSGGTDITGGAIESLEVDRSTVTDMPDGTRLIIGYPSAQATVTLSGYILVAGVWQSIAWLLNPNQADSPMYRYDALGASVTVQAGLLLQGSATAEQYTIFTGYVDDYTVDMEAGTVTLTCLDPKTKMTGAPSCPSVYDAGGATPGVPTLAAQFALDSILRAQKVYSWPARRSNCVLAAGMRGNAYPEVGTLTNLLVQSAGNLFQQGASAGMGLTGYAAYTLGTPIPVASPVFFEFWFDYSQATNPVPDVLVQDAGTGATIEVQADNTKVAVYFRPDLTGLNDTVINLTLPYVSGYHGVRASWVGTAASATAWRGGSTNTGSATTPVSRPAVTLKTATITQIVNASKVSVIDSVQITTEGSSAPFNNGFVPGAQLSESLNWITVIPDLTGADIWSTFQAIAEAEMGVAGFDELGVFRFINRDTIRTASPVRTITPAYSLKALQQQVGNSFVRNHIQVPVAAVQVQAFSTVWQATDAVYIGAGQVYTTVATTTDSIVGLATTCGLIPSGGLVSTSGYRAARNPDATKAVTNLVMTVTQTGPTTVTVTVTNPNGFGVYLITPSGAGYPAGSIGAPALAVGGHNVIPAGSVVDTTTGQTTANQVTSDWQWPPLSEGGAITNSRGEQLLPFPANAWIQSQAAGDALAQAIGEDLYRPKPIWRNVTIVADPRLQLVDRVTVNDPDTTGVNDDARIFGITTKLSSTEWDMTCDLRAVATPGGWLIGKPGRSEIGATTWI